MRIVSILFVACIAAGCARVQTDPASGRTDVDVESPTKQGEDWSGSIAGQGTGAGITGTSQARVTNGETTISISLTGATEGGVHPWHVHEGACGSGGPIVGDPAAYSPLIIGSGGQAQSTARITGALNEAKDYFVNVHASPSDLTTIIACGDLDD